LAASHDLESSEHERSALNGIEGKDLFQLGALVQHELNELDRRALGAQTGEKPEFLAPGGLVGAEKMSHTVPVLLSNWVAETGVERVADLTELKWAL
jgi:hypothetical protein